MNQQTRERALRTMAAALLSSDLTPAAIREVAQSFKTDPSLAEQLGVLVEVIAASLPVPLSEPKRAHSKHVNDAARRGEQLLKGAQGATFWKAAELSALSKEDLRHRLQSYVQNPDWNPNPDWSLRKICEEFVKVAPASSLGPALVAIQAGPVKRDPYVELIMTAGDASNGGRGSGFMQPGKPGRSIGGGRGNKGNSLMAGKKANNPAGRKAING